MFDIVPFTARLHPGQLVVVMPGALVNRTQSNEESYTTRYHMAIVIRVSHMWREPEGRSYDDFVQPTYVVLFSNDSRTYSVPAGYLCSPDELTDPGRLFNRLSG